MGWERYLGGGGEISIDRSLDLQSAVGWGWRGGGGGGEGEDI